MAKHAVVLRVDDLFLWGQNVIYNFQSDLTNKVADWTSESVPGLVVAGNELG